MFKSHFINIVILILVVFLAYWSSLNGIWALDDVEINKSIGLMQAFEEFGARKISYLSFALNQQLTPHEPIFFRLFNIFIHLLNSILIYLLVIFTLRLPQFKENFAQYSSYIALISAAIFALHPLNINAVAYIVQRMTSLSAFFVLLSLFMYILADSSVRTSKRLIFYAVAIISLVLGILSKENAVMTVPLIVLYDFVFLSPADKNAFKKRLGAVVLCTLMSFILLSFFIPFHTLAIDILRSFADISAPLAHKSWMATDVFWSPIEHILTEFRVISRYLFLFILPLPQFLVFDWWGYPVSTGLLEPFTTILSIAFILAMLAYSIIFLRRFVFLSFGILWYLIAISLESFIALGSDLYFEHRNYLPLAGLISGLVMQIFNSLKGRVFSNKYAFWIIFFSVSIILGLLTYQRNLIWQNPVVFWSDTVKKVPYNLRANLALGSSYLHLGDFKNAEIYFLNTLNIAIKDRRSYFAQEAFYRLGFMNLYLEQVEQSRNVIERFENLLPDSPNLLILKGFNKYLQQDYDASISFYKKSMQDKKFFHRNKALIHSLMGDAYRDMGQFDMALNSYQTALKENSFFIPANHGMAKLAIAKRDFNKAEEYLATVIKHDPYNFHALSDMANLILLRHQDISKALHYAQRAISNRPPSYKPYLIMGTIELVKGDEKAAERYFILAREFNVPGYLIPFNKAWGYALKGDTTMQKIYLNEILIDKTAPQHIRGTASKILAHLSD